MKLLTSIHLLFYSYCVQARIEIPLEINDGGYLFVIVVLNDSETARFMLDTGAGINVISTPLFNRIKNSLKVKGRHTGVRHNGESTTGKIYELGSLSVGHFRKTSVVVGEYAGLNNCDGLLSMDFFRDTPFTIDFINKKLIIEDKESLSEIRLLPDKIPIQLKTNGKHELDIFVTICINDSVRAQAEFDTGAGFAMLMLNTTYLEKLKIVVPETKTNDLNYYVYATTLHNLTYCNLPNLAQTNHFVGFKVGLIYDAVIGSGMFNNCKLTIDIPGGQMIVRR